VRWAGANGVAGEVGKGHGDEAGTLGWPWRSPPGRSRVILDQAAMIARISERTVPEPADQAAIATRYQALLALHAQAARRQPDGSAA
jgi:hypothetical protein